MAAKEHTGHVGNVGVPGLLLRVGISFYSNQYGFSANNVIAYEVSLLHNPSTNLPDISGIKCKC